MIAAKAKDPGKAKAEAPGQKASQQPASPQAPVFNPLWQRLALGVQAKLAVSAPDDPYEREADRVAEQVMRMPEPDASTAAASPPMPPICKECEVEARTVRRALAINAPTPATTVDMEMVVRSIDRQAVSRKDKSTAEAGDDGTLAAEAAEAVAHRGPGRPLSEASRLFFEPRFGADFRQVRLHDGPAAAEASRRLNARAFAYGPNIWLGARESESNRPLLAHELVHVVQQQRTPKASATLHRYVRTNTVYLRDVYEAAGRDPSAVTDVQLRTTIEYEDYTRTDLVWRFSDTVAIAALRRSMDLFAAGVRGREANYIRSGREARAAAHGIASIFVTELGFTGDLPITAVPGGLGTAKGALIDDPDGSSPVWTIGGTRQLVAYPLAISPTLFAKFSVVPAVAAPVPGVRLRARVGGAVIGEAAGLEIRAGGIENAGTGSGQVTGIGGGAAIPGADVGDLDAEVSFETSTDGGTVWFASGSATVRMVFTAATPSPPGGDLREDALDWGGLVIGSAATAAEDLRRLVRSGVFYDPSVIMPSSFENSDAVMRAFVVPHQCDTQAYLLRYLALTFGLSADVFYFWYGTSGEAWHYQFGSWQGPTFQCDRPAEDLAGNHPHFTFHALTTIGGTQHDPSYDQTGLPGILEHAPGAAPQTAPRASFLAAVDRNISWTCPH